MSYQGSITVFTHVVNWSVPEETISSKPYKISSLEKKQFRAFRKGTELPWVDEVAPGP